jgi:hypothetical protein
MLMVPPYLAWDIGTGAATDVGVGKGVLVALMAASATGVGGAVVGASAAGALVGGGACVGSSADPQATAKINSNANSKGSGDFTRLNTRRAIFMPPIIIDGKSPNNLVLLS